MLGLVPGNRVAQQEIRRLQGILGLLSKRLGQIAELTIVRGYGAIVGTPGVVSGRACKSGEDQHTDDDNPCPQAGRSCCMSQQRAGRGFLRRSRAARHQPGGPITFCTARSRSRRENGLAITCCTPSASAVVHDPASPGRNCPEIAIKGVAGCADLTADNRFLPSCRGMYTSTMTRSALYGA